MIEISRFKGRICKSINNYTIFDAEKLNVQAAQNGQAYPDNCFANSVQQLYDIGLVWPFKIRRVEMV